MSGKEKPPETKVMNYTDEDLIQQMIDRFGLGSEITQIETFPLDLLIKKIADIGFTIEVSIQGGRYCIALIKEVRLEVQGTILDLTRNLIRAYLIYQEIDVEPK